MTAVGRAGAPPRFQLVLHHAYHLGSAQDLSGHGNDGQVMGRGTGAGRASHFDGRSSRIVVYPSRTLTDLAGLVVGARVKLDEFGDRRTIVEGYLSFALVVDGDGTVSGAVYVDRRWEEVRTWANAVVLGRWLDITFGYDGMDTSWLSLDGELATARYRRLGRVGSVAWPYGLNIGAWPDGDLRVWAGEISELRLWRLAR